MLLGVVVVAGGSAGSSFFCKPGGRSSFFCKPGGTWPAGGEGSAAGAEGVLLLLGVLAGALAGALLGELAGGAEGALVPPEGALVPPEEGALVPPGAPCPPPAGLAKASLASKSREIKNAASTTTTTAKPRTPTWCQPRCDLVPTKFSVALVYSSHTLASVGRHYP